MVVLSAVVLAMMAMVAAVVLTEVVRCAVVERALSMMKRPSMVVGCMMLVLAVVISIIVTGPTLLREHTTFRAVRLTFLMEPTMMAEPPWIIGFTKVVGATMMSPATMVVLIMNGYLFIGMVGEVSAMRCS